MEEIKESNVLLSESIKELSKKEPKKMKSIKEKIMQKKLELEALEKMYAEKQKKEKNKWITNILNPVKDTLKKIYEKEDKEKDLDICTALIYAVENYKELSEIAGIENYVTKNKTTMRILRVHKEEEQENINEKKQIEERE